MCTIQSRSIGLYSMCSRCCLYTPAAGIEMPQGRTFRRWSGRTARHYRKVPMVQMQDPFQEILVAPPSGPPTSYHHNSTMCTIQSRSIGLYSMCSRCLLYTPAAGIEMPPGRTFRRWSGRTARHYRSPPCLGLRTWQSIRCEDRCSSEGDEGRHVVTGVRGQLIGVPQCRRTRDRRRQHPSKDDTTHHPARCCSTRACTHGCVHVIRGTHAASVLH
jgi:hypothetical protein